MFRNRKEALELRSAGRCDVEWPEIFVRIYQINIACGD